jgi:hypothetical protein
MTSRLDHSKVLGVVREVATANSMYAYRNRLAGSMKYLFEPLDKLQGKDSHAA